MTILVPDRRLILPKRMRPRWTRPRSSIANYQPNYGIPAAGNTATIANVNPYLNIPFAGGGGAPVPPPPPPPTPGMSLWLNQVSLPASGNITSWVDQSGNGYNASPVSGTPPVPVSLQGGFYYAGNMYTAGNGFVTNPNTPVPAYLNTGFGVYALVIPVNTNPFGTSTVWSAGQYPGAGDILEVGLFTDGKVRMAAGSTANGFGILESSGAATLDVPQLWRFRGGANGVNLKLKQSGEAQQNGTGVASYNSTPRFSMVGTSLQDTGLYTFNGYIAELIVYPFEPTDVQDTTIANYFIAEYGVAG